MYFLSVYIIKEIQNSIFIFPVSALDRKLKIKTHQQIFIQNFEDQGDRGGRAGGGSTRNPKYPRINKTTHTQAEIVVNMFRIIDKHIPTVLKPEP